MKRTWQARLQMKHDLMKRKLNDNLIEHEGSPTDCIRIRCKRNAEGDITSRIIEKADIVSVIFPPMQDIPYRRLYKDNRTEKLNITSLPSSAEDEAKEEYTIITPHNEVLLNDDIIIRIMIDPEVHLPIVLALEVLEPLGTFGGSMLIQSKFKCCLYNDTLSEEVLEVIKNMAIRRLQINF